MEKTNLPLLRASPLVYDQDVTAFLDILFWYIHVLGYYQALEVYYSIGVDLIISTKIPTNQVPDFIFLSNLMTNISDI